MARLHRSTIFATHFVSIALLGTPDTDPTLQDSIPIGSLVGLAAYVIWTFGYGVVFTCAFASLGQFTSGDVESAA